MRLRALPLTLALAAGAAPSEAWATPFVTTGLTMSFTPGYRVPLGMGFGFEAGTDGISAEDSAWDVSVGDRWHVGGSGFVRMEWRGFHVFRASFGGRTLVLHPVGSNGLVGTYGGVGPSAGAALVLRNHGGHGVAFEAGGVRLGIAGMADLRADTVLPFQPARGAELGMRGEYPLQETSVVLGGGVNLALPILFVTDPPSGRPVRDARGRLHLPVARIGRGASAEAEEWVARGRAEQASVPAFVQLAAELGALGAPGALVGRALRAAADERRHALLCYAMAERAAGSPVWVGPDPAWRVRGGARAERLRRIARESLVDGVVGEGAAAGAAAGRRDRARDEVEARVEHAIAVEEAGHAALARDVLRWARDEGAGATV